MQAVGTQPIRSFGPGHMVATLGAAALVISLFATWYKLGLPADAQTALRTGTGQSSGMDEIGRQFGVALLDAFLNIKRTGWEAFEFADLALVGCAAAPFVVPFATRRPDVGPVFAAAGTIALGIVLVKMADQPDPAQLWQLGPGPLIALAGATAMALGGKLAR